MLNINRFIEQTILNPDLTERDIDRLVDEANEFQFLGICVPPCWVRKASKQLKNSGIQLVTVIGFPFGYQTTETKTDGIKQAIDQGVNELDIVMNISAFKSGASWTKTELAQCAKLIHGSNCLMKVIIETALLSDDEIVAASKMCQEAHTDFVKTSTGFAAAGAKPEHVKLIKSVISNNVGVKASGGIRDLQTARAMIDAGADRLGVSAGVAIMKEAEATNQL